MHPSTTPALRVMVVQALKSNWRIGAVLGLLALSVIVGYQYVMPVREVLNTVAAYKEHYGFRFAMVSTALFGGLLPLLIDQMRARPNRHLDVMTVAFMILFWAYKGAELDLLYHTQARVFGDDDAWRTVLVKTFFDAFVYVPIWAMPSVVLAYHFLDERLRLRRAWRHLGPQWYRRRILPVLLVNWIIWIPSVLVIYSLPLALQLPVQNIILLFFAIILLFMTARTPDLPATGVEATALQDQGVVTRAGDADHA